MSKKLNEIEIGKTRKITQKEVIGESALREDEVHFDLSDDYHIIIEP